MALARPNKQMALALAPSRKNRKWIGTFWEAAKEECKQSVNATAWKNWTRFANTPIREHLNEDGLKEEFTSYMHSMSPYRQNTQSSPQFSDHSPPTIRLRENKDLLFLP
jgi:hypothetical protein